MCFTNDYDWTAEVFEETERAAEKETRCGECRRKFPPGTVMRHLWMQEHEECSRCSDAECDCPKDADGDCAECKCEEPSLGEEFEYDVCPECDKLLKAVEAAEKEEGCHASESQPPLAQLFEQMRELDKDDVRRYVRKAEGMFPELAASGYLGLVARKTRLDADEEE